MVNDAFPHPGWRSGVGGGDGKVDSPVRVRRHHRHPFLSVSISPPKGTGERSGYRREFIFKRGGRGGEHRTTGRPTRGGGRGCARTPPAPERAREHPIAQPRHPSQHGRRCRRRRLRGITDGQPGKQPLSEAKETVLPRPPPRLASRRDAPTIASPRRHLIRCVRRRVARLVGRSLAPSRGT